jgi:hypothetical protein
MTDEQIDDLWIRRKDIHNGELMPQLRDFARAVLAASQPKPCLHVRLRNDTCEDCGATFLFI